MWDFSSKINIWNQAFCGNPLKFFSVSAKPICFHPNLSKKKITPDLNRGNFRNNQKMLTFFVLSVGSEYERAWSVSYENVVELSEKVV